MKRSSLLTTARKEILTFKLFYIAVPVAVLYALLTLYMVNYRLFLDPTDPLLFKLKLMIAFLPGFLTNFTPFDLTLLIITSCLVGINIMLAIATVRKVKKQGNVTLSVGGASIIGLASAGCTTCGISLFSIFGLSAAVSFLPFHGIELHIAAVVLLLLSLWYMIKKLHEEVYCKIQTQRASRN